MTIVTVVSNAIKESFEEQAPCSMPKKFLTRMTGLCCLANKLPMAKFFNPLFSFMLLIGSSSMAIATGFQNIAANRDTVGLYEKFEITFELTENYQNPFDPHEADVQAHFLSPSGKKIFIPAFWFQDYRRALVNGFETLGPVAGPVWKARFAPQEPGTYIYFLAVKDKNGQAQSDSATFHVLLLPARGFIRVNPDARSHLRFDNQEYYFPRGHNVAWMNEAGTFDYDMWFAKMGEAGENWSRIWFTHFFRGQTLEWFGQHYPGLGRYSLAEAWRWDYYLELARQHGIYLQAVTQHHGQFSKSVDAAWNENPYNARNGGPLAEPEHFFSDAAARELYKRKLRYLVARWGYSPNILAWELFNEVQFTQSYPGSLVQRATVAAWHQAMANYLKTIDPWQHLITTSARLEDDLIWNLPVLDLVQIHYYGGDPAGNVNRLVAQMRRFNKPVIAGESGVNAGPDFLQLFDPQGLHVQDLVWGVSMAASGAMPWWWDQYLHPNDLYRHYSVVRDYWREEDLFRKNVQAATFEVTGGASSEGVLTLMPSYRNDLFPPTEIIIAANRPISQWENFSPYLPAANAGAAQRTFTLHVQTKFEGRFLLHVRDFSPVAQPAVEIHVDDQPVILHLDSTSSSHKIFSASLPAGKHAITVRNNGAAEIEIAYLQFTGWGNAAAEAFGLAGPQQAFAWVRDTRLVFGQPAPGSLRGVKVRAPQVQAGRYEVEFWHPQSGLIARVNELSNDTGLLITLPDFERALAFKARYLGPPIGVEEKEQNRPADFVLLPGYPNPLKLSQQQAAHFTYQIPFAQHVTLKIFDLLGREVRTLVDEMQAPGRHVMSWNGREDTGNFMAPGIYWCRLTIAGKVQAQMMSIVN